MGNIYVPDSRPLRLKPKSLETPRGSGNNPPISLPFSTELLPTNSYVFSPPSSRPTTTLPTKWEPHFYQQEPDGNWDYWALYGGRGIGKTATAAHWIDSKARNAKIRIAIGAPTLKDARRICVEGETGLLAVNPEIRFNLQTYELHWPKSGAVAQLFGAFTPEDIERWRGPQFHLAWLDELASWRYLDECWANLRFGLRLGSHPRLLATFTPRPRKFIKELLKNPRTIVAKTKDGRIPTTDDNPGLASVVREALYEDYGGTRLGRQELGGELLEDVQGALWQAAWIEQNRVKAAPDLVRIVVAIDPAATAEATSDYTGLCVAGLGADGEYYVLRSQGVRLSPSGWAHKAIDWYDEFGADRIIAEVNQGGDMVAATLKQVRRDLPIKVIHASRGKTVRAEPVATLDEQGKCHHVGQFATLEDQMFSFPVATEHDDEVDARVYAVTELMQRRSYAPL